MSNGEINTLDRLKNLTDDDRATMLEAMEIAKTYGLSIFDVLEIPEDIIGSDLWDEIDIDLDKPIAPEEAYVRGLKVHGLIDNNGNPIDYTGHNKFSIIMNGELYYWNVSPQYTEKFLNDFKKINPSTGKPGKFYERTNGREPFLIESIEDKSESKLDKLLQKQKEKFNLKPISELNHFKNELNFAIQDNNAELVDNLYVHIIDGELDLSKNIQLDFFGNENIGNLKKKKIKNLIFIVKDQMTKVLLSHNLRNM